MSSESFHRLTKNVVPSVYHLFIDASRLEEFLFSGTVRIEIEIFEKTEQIVLNSFGLTIDQIELRYSDSQIFRHETVEFDGEFERIKIRFAQTLEAGKSSLFLKFSGTILDQLHGFYRTNENGRIGACSQFEPNYARRAFPCFDEPCFKAKFHIQIRSPKNLVTLSNMPVKSRNDDDETSLYEFDPTPIMSTYLVAFVIGAYDFIETRDRNNLLIRVYTPVGKKEQGIFALHTASEILPFYADYFGIEYPLEKLDMIAVADFGVVAMENWGLITFHETCLLVDSHFTSESTKQYTAFIVAHELAHQWFGNLVTMEWWDDLWLNEGFATWIQFLAVDHVYPEYGVWTQFLSDVLGTFMESDSLHHGHPIEMMIESSGEIDEIFDDITYEKGASVIRFLHGFIGDEPFRRGLSNYLQEFSYKNSRTEDLWAHLSRASNRENLSEILSSWTKKMGFPLLIVEQKQNFNDRILTIEQRRFFFDGTIDDQFRWKIPVNICTKSNPTEIVHSLFLDEEKKSEFLLEKLSETDWIKLNLFNIGIYRVFYPLSTFESFVPSIQDQTLSAEDRFNLENDFFALAKSSLVNFVDYLKFLRHGYKHEENLTVWKSIIHHLNELNSILNFSKIDSTKKIFQNFLCDLLTIIYSKLEWDPLPNEGSQASVLRSLVLTQMGTNNFGRAVDQAKKRFEQFINNKQSINPNIRSPIYLTVAKNADRNIFQQFKTFYRSAETQEERIRWLTGLCSFDEPTIQDEALEFLWNRDEVRKQDHLDAFTCLAAHNRYGSEICWNYMKTNWHKIEEIYGQHDAHLIKFVQNVPGVLADEKYVKEVREFYEKQKNPFLDRPIKKVIEQIEIRRRIIDIHEAKVNEYLH